MAKYYHEDNEKVFSNPGMGWVIHHDIRKVQNDPNEPDHYEKLDNVALLSWWAYLEPEEGKYFFEDLDASIAKWKSLGKKLQFRISTDCMSLGSGLADGAPDWLMDHKKVPCQTFSESYAESLKARHLDPGVFIRRNAAEPGRYPDYLDPEYQKALKRFLCALADRYGDEKDLETVDLRGYGTWGEWHSGHEYPTYAQRVTALRSIIDAWHYAFSGKKTLMLSCSYEWSNSRIPPLHAPKNYEEYLYWSAFDYALTKPGISFRRDGIGGAVKIWDAHLMREFYRSGRRLPMISEYFDGYHSKSVGGRGYFVEDSVEEALLLHPNYMMLMWDSVDFYEKRPDLIDHGLRRMGYRLLPREVEIPNVAHGEGYVTIRHTWINLAVGRFCSQGSLLIRVAGYVTEDTGFDPGALSEGEPRTFHTPVRIPEQLPGGIHPVEFAVRGYDDRYINLPLDGRTEDGYYPVGNLIIAKEQ